MDEPLRLASIKFTRIVDRLHRPGKIVSWMQFPGRRISKCLEEQVLPPTLRLLASPSFQDLASDPLTTLVAADGSSRQIASQLRRLITKTVSDLKSFVQT